MTIKAKKGLIGPKTRKEKAVWQACDALLASNKQPTYLAIGEQLVKMGYKRGSNSDLRRYLFSWKEQTPAASKTKSQQPSKPSPAQELSPQLSLQTLLDLYEHHTQQIDRLMRIIELQKQENKILRQRLSEHKTATSAVQSLAKPRIKISFSGE